MQIKPSVAPERNKTYTHRMKAGTSVKLTELAEHFAETRSHVLEQLVLSAHTQFLGSNAKEA